MPRPPEQPRPVENLVPPLLLSSRFESREASQVPYDTIQSIVREKDVADFSVYRLLQNWPESMSKAPPSLKRWYVVALGNTPPEPLFTQVTEAISLGEPIPIPDEVVALLAEKRKKEIAARPYTEIHRHFTVPHKKEKMKRKMQKNSRRHNRGT